MASLSEPYFMSDDEWYTCIDITKEDFPEDGCGYHLTDKAPQEAVDSYVEFYGLLESLVSTYAAEGIS